MCRRGVIDEVTIVAPGVIEIIVVCSRRIVIALNITGGKVGRGHLKICFFREITRARIDVPNRAKRVDL